MLNLGDVIALNLGGVIASNLGDVIASKSQARRRRSRALALT